MRYPATEKLEIIRLVEQSDLSVRLTLEHLGIPRSTSTSGTIAIRNVASMALKINHRRRQRSGTGFPSNAGTR
jgi:transposase-like protein